MQNEHRHPVPVHAVQQAEQHHEDDNPNVNVQEAHPKLWGILRQQEDVQGVCDDEGMLRTLTWQYLSQPTKVVFAARAERAELWETTTPLHTVV